MSDSIFSTGTPFIYGSAPTHIFYNFDNFPRGVA